MEKDLEKLESDVRKLEKAQISVVDGLQQSEMDFAASKTDVEISGKILPEMTSTLLRAIPDTAREEVFYDTTPLGRFDADVASHAENRLSCSGCRGMSPQPCNPG